MSKIHLRKSTKILLIVLAVILVLGIILLIIFRNQIFADPSPVPGKEQPEFDPTSNGEWPPNDDKSTWKNNRVDSGLTIKLNCPTKEEVNNAAVNRDGSYFLDLKYDIAFFSRDNEYIEQTYFMIATVDTDPMVYENYDLKNERNNFNTSKLTISTYEDITYRIQLAVNVYKFGTILKRHEGFRTSTSCLIMKSRMNPEESIGEEEEGTAEEIQVLPDDECYDNCMGPKEWWRPGIMRSITQPIKSALCTMQCAVLEAIGDFYNLSLRLLEDAAGLK